MATATLYMSPITMIVQYLTNLGILAQGGTIQTYVGGSVNTPATTYTDSTGVVANPNPLSIDASGRPALPSGAHPSFWTQAGIVLKLVVNDAAGNQLISIDNISAINDLTNQVNALQTLLANPASSNVSGAGPVAGVDLVANGVKSYDIVADLRAANSPVLASGQTLVIELQGGSAINDGLGGEFYWAAASSAIDDSKTIIKPNSVLTANPGRWLRMYGLNTPQVVVLATDFSIVSNATPQPSALTLNLLSGGTYLVQLRLQLLGIGGTGQGWKCNCSVGSVATLGAGSGVITGNGTASLAYNQVNSAFAQAAISGGNNDVVQLDYLVQVSALTGFTVQVGQNSSSVNQTVLKAGSTLIVTRIA